MDAENKPSRRHRIVKPELPVPWWLHQAKERPLATAGTLISAAGGLVLLVFFCQLGAIPELDLAGASAVLMAVAALGFVLSASLTGCALAAGLVLRGNEPKANEFRTPKVLLSLALPGWISTAAFSFYLALNPKGNLPSWAFIFPFALMALFACVYSFMNTKSEVDSALVKIGGWGKFGRGFGYLAISYFWLLTACSAFLTFFVMYPRDGDGNWFLFNLVLWTTWCYFSNVILVKATKANTPALMAGCCAISLVILLAVTGNWTGLPIAVVRALGLGEIPVALVMTANGCDLLNKAAGGRQVCRVEAGEQTATVCPAILRSRIGTPFFIELSPYDEKGYWPQLHPPSRLAAIAIPKSEIPSWSRLTPMTKKEASGSPSSDSVVTYLNDSRVGSWVNKQCGESPKINVPNPVGNQHLISAPKVHP
jgi:hypothetical protein